MPIGIVYNSQNEATQAMAQNVVKSLRLEDRCWVSSASELDHLHSNLENTSLIVVAGGDGTSLSR